MSKRPQEELNVLHLLPEKPLRGGSYTRPPCLFDLGGGRMQRDTSFQSMYQSEGRDPCEVGPFEGTKHLGRLGRRGPRYPM